MRSIWYTPAKSDFVNSNESKLLEMLCFKDVGVRRSKEESRFTRERGRKIMQIMRYSQSAVPSPRQFQVD